MQPNPAYAAPGWLTRTYATLNLRPEEGHRTLLMFAFYTLMSMGLMWLEVISAALFLEEYGAEWLPLIYIFSAVVGVSLGTVYSWLDRLLPLGRVVVLIALLMALPLLLFSWGLGVATWAPITVFAMRLWMESATNLNELNLAVVANQLFNIREIKRAFPLVSSGNLVADVLSGFTLYFLVSLLGVEKIMYLVFATMLAAAAVLYYVSQAYRNAFPDSRRRTVETVAATFSARRLQRRIWHYVLLLVSFFAVAQMLMYLIEYQYLDQLTRQNFSVDTLASFLGIFTGILGILELLTQLLISSRFVERFGLFVTTGLLPAVTVTVTVLCLLAGLPELGGGRVFFIGLVILKFVDEWLRYTVFASTRPVLFQPIPGSRRARVQSVVGVAESVSIGGAGVLILLILQLLRSMGWLENSGARLFLLLTLALGLLWLGLLYRLRSRYLNLLVLTAERGLLSFSDASLRVLKQTLIETLEKSESAADQRSLIELLTQIDPRSIGEVLAPMLSDLSPVLQRQSLETMLEHPDSTFTDYVEALIHRGQDPVILALAVRYVWLTQADADLDKLKAYLTPDTDPMVRGTAASIILKRGQPKERAQATYVLQQMLTHERERERVMGCRALGEAVYMQGLRLHVNSLLRDKSLRVRHAMLQAIAATQLKEHYPSLLKALRYQSTREAATEALVRLGDEALPMLVEIAKDPYQLDARLRYQAWQVIGQIGSLRAVNTLISYMTTSKGIERHWLLRILVKLSDQKDLRRSRDIETALERLDRGSVERLIRQELLLVSHIQSGLADFSEDKISGETADWLRRALANAMQDCVERIFLLMRFLYPSNVIQAAELSLEGGPSSRARGLEILDNTLDIPPKRIILQLLDQVSDGKQPSSPEEMISYRPLSPAVRLSALLEQRHFLSDWLLACCFHVARTQKWAIDKEHVLACLRHPVGFVREAVLSYVEIVSPKSLVLLLPQMKADKNQLVANQVEALLDKYSLEV